MRVIGSLWLEFGSMGVAGVTRYGDGFTTNPAF